MNFQTCEDIGFQITRIDSGMIRPGLAACYLLWDGDEYALVETGTHHTIPIIMALLEARAIAREKVKYVIPTHVHLDHAGGVGGLMQQLPNATLLVHPRGARHMIDPDKLKAGATAVYGEAQFQKIYGDIIPVDAMRVQEMEDGDTVMLGSRTLSFYDTPGHARHHFCVHDSLSNGIFTGDTFGLAYPTMTTDKGPFIFPTTTPVQFDPDALKASIQKLLSLKPDRMFLTHYGPVEHPEQLASQLLAQIDDYVAMARELRNQVSAETLEPALIERMSAYTFARAHAHGCAQSDSELEAELGMDMRLNSQGLVVWLQSQTAG